MPIYIINGFIKEHGIIKTTNILYSILGLHNEPTNYLAQVRYVYRITKVILKATDNSNDNKYCNISTVMISPSYIVTILSVHALNLLAFISCYQNSITISTSRQSCITQDGIITVGTPTVLISVSLMI